MNNRQLLKTLWEKEKLLVMSNFSFSTYSAHNKQFLLFPHSFLLNKIIVSPFVHIFDILSLFAGVLKKPKLGISGKGSSNQVQSTDLWSNLTHYQTTNFRLFQTERVCRQQFQIRRKWQEVIQMGRKHCGKRRNCSLRAIYPFPTVFSKGLFPRGVKRRHCVGMG